MAFPLQDTPRDQTTGEMLRLSPFGAGLTGSPAEWSLTDATALFTLRADLRASAHRHGRPRQARGGAVWGAVSDDHHLQAPRQPTRLRPGGMAPRGPQDVALDPPVLREPTDQVPAVVAHALPQRLGWLPGVAEDRLRATAPAVAGIAAPRQRQRRLRRPALGPSATAQREAARPIGPDPPHEGEALPRLARRTGVHPGEALKSRRTGLRKDRIGEAQIAPRPDEERANSQLQACGPRPMGWQPSCHAVMCHGVPRLSESRAGGRRASIQQGGEGEPQQRWHRVRSFVVGGRELEAISPLLRSPRTMVP